MPFYFAYGSNMETAQMTRRVPHARALGRGRLDDFAFACNKVGRDGSAKANVQRSPGDVVWGVVFEISGDELAQLDRFEGGYRRQAAAVVRDDGRRVTCEVYVSDRTDPRLRPTVAYRDRMVRGALEHGLPEECRRALEALAVDSHS